LADPRFTIAETRLAGVISIARRRMSDERGFLSRIYCDEDLASVGLGGPIRQINQTLTLRRGTIRGMHFQYPPHAEGKLISVLQGSIFDVAIDIRAGSPTLLRWHGEQLSAENGRSLFVPPGCAHGFQTLTDNCVLLYLHTASYDPAAEGALSVFDPAVAIDWPLEVTDISARDSAHLPLPQDFNGI
jgi:dTDP-4-dehydrorhamnose 3,5-epimerase